MPSQKNSHPNSLYQYIYFISIAFISFSEDNFELLRNTKNSFFPHPKNDPPNIDDWLPLYYSHRKIKSVCWAFFKEILEHNGILQKLAECLNTNDSQRLSHLFSDELQEASCPPNVLAYIRSPEVSFFFKVILPCLLFYQKLPFILYREARQGSAAALDKILRIDKAVICDKRIAAYFYNASARNKKSSFQDLVTALKGSPKQKVSARNVKYMIAAIISVISEKLGHKLSSVEIRNIFNQYSADTIQDRHLDHDLPDSEEAFAKAIQRERPLWENIASSLQLDKIKF